MTGYDYGPDNRLLDRMVDGELTEHEQRELLVRLDNSGWRKLALAYVESQTWRGAFASLAKDRVEPKRRDPTPMARARVLSFSLITLVIGFLLAVGLGYLFDFVPRDRGETNIIVNETDDDKQRPNERPVVVDPNQVRFVVDNGAADGALQQIDVPLIDASQVDNDWIDSHVTTIPPHLRSALEQRGHQVIERRYWHPIELPDGRRLLLPVDDVQLRFATTDAVQ